MIPRIGALVDWLVAPEWVTLERASYLTGHDVDLLRDMAQRGELEARHDGKDLVIEKADLQDYQATLREVVRGYWG